MDDNRSAARTIVGALLIIAGLAALVSQQFFFGIDLGHYVWPFFVIIPGLLFFAGMAAGGPKSAGLAIPGAIVTMTGLILLYQNTLHHWQIYHWQSWAYAWALVAPTSVGIGRIIQANWSGQRELIREGKRMVRVGLTIFLIGAVFFEVVLNISGLVSGFGGKVALPLILIAVGVYLLLRRLGGESDRRLAL